MIKDVTKTFLKVHLGSKLSPLNGCKKNKFEKTKQIKIIDKSGNYSLRGERNTRYYDRILSN